MREIYSINEEISFFIFSRPSQHTCTILHWSGLFIFDSVVQSETFNSRNSASVLAYLGVRMSVSLLNVVLWMFSRLFSVFGMDMVSMMPQGI
jgi:hypothetical protein